MKRAHGFIILLVLVLVIASPAKVFALAADTGDGFSAAKLRGSSTEVKDTATETTTNGFSEDELEDMRTKNSFEKVISDFLLGMGDYAHDYLTQLFKQDVSIDKIVFNDVVLLNANFFTKSENPSGSDATKVVRRVINTWYESFRMIALLVCVGGIVVAGIKILLGTPEGKNSAKDILKKVVLGVMLVYFFPFVMKMGFDINEALISMIRSGIISGNYASDTIRVRQISELQVDPDMEFRSPSYVSNSSRRFGAGSDEANAFYFSKLQTYAGNNDIMRIMRAFAGVTQRFMYVIIWYILLVQTYFFVYVYLKRYVTIAFLLAIYPLTIIGYVAGGLSGKAKTSFNDWCSKFFGNIFMQTIHALTYGAISGVIISQLRNGLPDKVNWIVMIIAVTFLMTGENILTNLWHLATNAAASKEDLGKAFGNSKKVFRGAIGTLHGK